MCVRALINHRKIGTTSQSVERRTIVRDTFMCISSIARPWRVRFSPLSFLPFSFLRETVYAAEFCASRFVIIAYPYRAVTAGSNSFVSLGQGVASRRVIATRANFASATQRAWNRVHSSQTSTPST